MVTDELDNQAMIPLHYYRPRGKWATVTVFEREPTHPRTSKEGMDVAKFVGEGDAYAYAVSIAKRPGFRHHWGVVIR